MSSVTAAGVCIRTNQLDFDDEVAFARSGRSTTLHEQMSGGRFCWSLPSPTRTIRSPCRSATGTSIATRISPLPRRRRTHSIRILAGFATSAPSTRNGHESAGPRRAARLSRSDRLFRRPPRTADGCLEGERPGGDTIVILTSDHGEMLGDRGLWYKMSFFEGAAASRSSWPPGRFAPRRVGASVSLLDLLPTLVDFSGGDAGALRTPSTDGALRPTWSARAGHDEAIGEYLAEGAIAPMVMIRRGAFKFIHSPPTPTSSTT